MPYNVACTRLRLMTYTDYKVCHVFDDFGDQILLHKKKIWLTWSNLTVLVAMGNIDVLYMLSLGIFAVVLLTLGYIVKLLETAFHGYQRD